MRYLLAFALSLAMAVPAFAAFEGPGATQPSSQMGMGGGFQGPGANAQCSTAADAMKAWDDTYCTVEGRIVEKIVGAKDKYIFEDSTGKIQVDIDRKKFADRTVTPQNTVRLHGEVDVEHFGRLELDVDVLEIIR